MYSMSDLIAETGVAERTINRLVRFGGLRPPIKRSGNDDAVWTPLHLADLRSWVAYRERHVPLNRRTGPTDQDARGRFVKGNRGGSANADVLGTFCRRQTRARTPA